MAQKQYDLSKFEYQGNTLYYGLRPATPTEQRTFNRRVGTRKSLDAAQKLAKYGDKFSKSSFTKGGRMYLPKWAEPLSVRGGKNPDMRYRKVAYTREFKFDLKGNVVEVDKNKVTTTSKKWGTRVASGKNGTLKGFEGMIQHLQMAAHLVNLSGESFRMLTAERALKVFQTSFLKHMFYTRGATPWPKLSEVTKKKRERRGSKPGPVLVEFGDLAKSLEIEKSAKGTAVITKKVSADRQKQKKHTNCYGGWHNEGTGTYWNTGIRYKKRQFMGHSSYLDPETDPFMRKMCKLYLFDEVFLSPK